MSSYGSTANPSSVDNPFKTGHEAGQRVGDLKTVKDGGRTGFYAVVPEGFKLEDLRPVLESRESARKAITVTVYDAQSFSDYFNRHKTADSIILANPTTGSLSIEGVIDYHGTKTAAYCEHRVKLPIRTSRQWDAWKATHNKSQSQADFAQFVEDNSKDFLDPAAATMREIATDLQVRNDVTFGQATRLKDGQVKIAYAENIQGRAGASGEIEIPEKFRIKIPVLLRGAEYEIEAFLRYRVSGGKLNMWYMLHRADDILDDAFQRAVSDINTLTTIKALIGNL